MMVHSVYEIEIWVVLITAITLKNAVVWQTFANSIFKLH